MFLQPIGFHQRLWMRVLRRVRCHRNRNSIRRGASASEFANAAPRLPNFGEIEAADRSVTMPGLLLRVHVQLCYEKRVLVRELFDSLAQGRADAVPGA